jgi:hypothetical protein
LIERWDAASRRRVEAEACRQEATRCVGPGPDDRSEVATAADLAPTWQRATGADSGRRFGDVPTGRAARAGSVHDARPRGSVERSRSTEPTTSEVGRWAKGQNRLDRLQRPTGGAGEMDASAPRGGGNEAWRCTEGFQEGHPENLEGPRPEAVAGKKCGAYRN